MYDDDRFHHLNPVAFFFEEQTRPTIEAHLSLNGWVGLELFNGMGTWGMWNPELRRAYCEDTQTNKPVRTAPLHHMDAYDIETVRLIANVRSCRECSWKTIPDLTFDRIARLIITGRT